MGSVQGNDVERLRAALRDPSLIVDDRRTAEAHHMLVSHVLARIGRALEAAGCDALMAKGAALIETVYPEPWHRAMADVDLIARPGEVERVLAALRAGGLSIEAQPEDRPMSHDQIGERRAAMRFEGVAVAVEVHARLDKVVGRPVDYAAMFRRAAPSATSRNLLLPDRIDQTLLVVIHLSNSDFDHMVAWLDLELLIRDDFDWDELMRRVRAAELGTATWLSLMSLEALGSTSVPSGVLRALEPGPARKRALARRFRLGCFPPRHDVDPPTGWAWMMAQTPLRDDLGRWGAGIARYAAARTVERLLVRRR